MDTRLASRWMRLGGALFDSLIIIAVMIPILIFIGYGKDFQNLTPMTMKQTTYAIVAGWIIFLLLNGYLLATYGQTIGKRIVRTRIANLYGEVPPLSRIIFLRYLPFGLLGQIPLYGSIIQLVNVLFIFRKDRRCLHDHLARTMVVNFKAGSKLIKE
ncbi:MAG: RDD family protein [Kiritimatiellae bacterium]|jgi:uncharacterized RDD family membrane protein YckC|nr:RDD family protein [Kiritimatiellia bacterium]